MNSVSENADVEPETFARLSGVLRRAHRRRVLDYFDETGEESASVARLAEYVAEHSTESPVDEQRINIRLYHVDFPVLAEAGIVDYDRQRMTVRYHGHPNLKTDGERWRIIAGDKE